jgi:fumarate hydratase class II
VAGIKANKEKMKSYLYNSLMTVTGLTPIIGYENAARVVHKAHSENITLKESCLSLGYLDEKTFDEKFHPEKMI